MKRGKRSIVIRRRKHITLFLFTLILTLTCSLRFGVIFSSAHETNKTHEIKYYRSIQIQEGDSLWSIAEEHMDDNYESIFEYMEEIADINNLKSSELDSIQEGHYLTIAYYE